MINVSLMMGAIVYLGRGEKGRARALYEEGLSSAWRLRMMHATAAQLNVAAALAGSGGQPGRSARLWGAAEALRNTIGAVLSPVIERSCFAPHTATARAGLAEGRAMSTEEAVEYALKTEGPADRPPGVATAAAPSSLSARESEILVLVSEGLTNPQVAERLYLSPRTVGQHLRSVYRKLGVSSRTAAAREALERGLF